jgi:S1-C subfamily serine protease
MDKEARKPTREKAPPKRSSKMIMALVIAQSITLAAVGFMFLVFQDVASAPHIIMTAPQQGATMTAPQQGATDVPPWFNDVTARVRSPFSGTGTSVAVSDRLVLTNFHVVAKAGVGGTVWIDASHGTFVGKVIAFDQAHDLALVEAPADFAFKQWARLSKSQMKWGQRVFVVGCANGNLPIPSAGYYVREAGNGTQISALSFFGSSGGPVFNADGGLVGLVTIMDKPAEQDGQKVFPNYIFYCTRTTWMAEFLEPFLKKP